MAIKVEQALVKANEQNFEFKSVRIEKIKSGIGLNSLEELQATVIFNVKNENGLIVDIASIKYTGNDYNTFWTNFNSGQFLYEEFVSKKSIQVQITNAVESDFLNG